jgi:RNA polymerase sigma-70 factor (ECF subfamily)
VSDELLIEDPGVQTSESRLKSLMLRGLDGDAPAQRELLRELGRLLRPYFAKRTGDDASDADDLVQEVLIAVHTRRATYDRSQLFTAWVYAIARYKLVDHLRRRRVRASVPIDDADDLFAEDASETATAGRDVQRLMADLPEKQRSAIQHTKLDELSVAETAARTGMSESAVKVSVHRGMKALAARVRGVGKRVD